jgi:hypothetical protein
MRITYDFFQRVVKLPADQLGRATALKGHLFGSLSATGVINFINFTFSALPGPVFAWLLARVSRATQQAEHSHDQMAFLPLLAGVVIAILLTMKLKETGAAAKESR